MKNKFGGFGGLGNMQGLMKQAQQMQEKMAEAQSKLDEMEIEGSSGGGLVTVTMNGKKLITAVKIDPKAVDVDDLEMLEDLIIAAANEGYNKADEQSEELMGPLAGGMGGLL